VKHNAQTDHNMTLRSESGLDFCRIRIPMSEITRFGHVWRLRA